MSFLTSLFGFSSVQPFVLPIPEPLEAPPPEDLPVQSSSSSSPIINQSVAIIKVSQQRLERSVDAAMAKLHSNDGEMLREEGIFRTSCSRERMRALKQEMPLKFETNDAYLLAGFVKACFQINKERSNQEIEFLPQTFSWARFQELSDAVEQNPQWLKGELANLFSQQSECVKHFILLFKKASQFQQANNMGIRNLAIVLNPFLTSPFEVYCSSSLAEFLIQHAEEIFPESALPSESMEDLEDLPEIEPLDLPPELLHSIAPRKRLENTISAIIDTLSSEEGELLKTKHIFAVSGSRSDLERVQKELPESFDVKTDPHLLACFIKILFHQKANDNPLIRVRFLPAGFTFQNLMILTNFVKTDSKWVKGELHRIFSRQNEYVKRFILLLHKTARLNEINDMTAYKLARVVNPLLCSQFSVEEMVASPVILAEFIIEHAEEIFAEEIPSSDPWLDNGEMILVEPIDSVNAENVNLWIEYKEWFLSHLKLEESDVSSAGDEYIPPSEALDRIDRLFLLIPRILSYTKNKEKLLEQIDRLRVEMIELDRADEDAQFLNEQLTTMRKTLEVFQAKIELKKDLGFRLNRQLNQIIERKHSDITLALRELKNGYQELDVELKQVTQDIWRSTMTIINPAGEQMLISQSEISSRAWQHIFNRQDGGDLAYGPIETAKEANLPEEIEVSALAQHVARSLDCYLSKLGFSSQIKLNIYRNFQQRSLAGFDPEARPPEFWLQAQSSPDLQTRFEAYSRAYWKFGFGFPPIEPGSKLDTDGFARYVSHRSDQPRILWKRALLFTLDLRMRSVFSHFMVQFENPKTQEKEVYHYRSTHSYELQPPSFEELPPEAFPDLAKLKQLPKFPLLPLR